MFSNGKRIALLNAEFCKEAGKQGPIRRADCPYAVRRVT